ncbi:hypothetical protein D477_008608 [Arthrobacter crystallopoietes BAB-32]|uniref:Integral membrane protein n=1 Tax=Arthrobacter crystallopoietes BAB-32 TaxID=1246476 RepID=N1V3L9_9MICC|nr:hypothetical protein D477_008608 [Arthrobacter crystallopoietes BAB-32]
MCHIVAAGAWIGIDVIVAVLVLVGWFADDLGQRSLAYRALAQFTVAPMLAAGLTCLLSGVLLGLGTKWGLLRYWWVAVKLGLNVVLCTVMVTVLAPGMPDLDRYGAGLLTGATPDLRIASMFFPPAVSLTALTFAVILAVAKPWGLTRGGDK